MKRPTLNRIHERRAKPGRGYWGRARPSTSSVTTEGNSMIRLFVAALLCALSTMPAAAQPISPGSADQRHNDKGGNLNREPVLHGGRLPRAPDGVWRTVQHLHPDGRAPHRRFGSHVTVTNKTDGRWRGSGPQIPGRSSGDAASIFLEW